ncbi:MAG: tRNA preQ1(34) S-adenosylmethionine ribosyltransferase-isomerase QueA [Acidiferrobacterales bacterium]
MRIDEFDYRLPDKLIAQHPTPTRSASRLLVLDGGSGDIKDLHFVQLTRLLHAGDLLVFNNTRVIPARLFGKKQTGGEVELLIERVLNERAVLAQLRASKPVRVGTSVSLEGAVPAQVIARRGEFYELYIEHPQPVLEILDCIGHVPLPPYITRSDRPGDRDRYQTVYAQVPGAVAAPTAGLHFDATMFAHLAAAGVQTAFLTLRIGAGTFQPVRSQDIRNHRLHAESVEIDEAVCTAVETAQSRGGQIIAVGTTVVRALEAAADKGCVRPFAGETELYIYPGYQFQVIDALITNFHLPRSSLLVLVCAFAGTDNVRKAYEHAVRERYRFYSYGDAMFITHRMASGK